MKEKLEALNRNLFFNAMRMLLFTIPICLITDKIYVYKFGNYNIIFNVEYALNFLVHEKEKWLFGFFVFCLLFMFTFILEKEIFPKLVILFIKKIKISRITEIKTNLILKRIYNFNPLLYINKINKNEIISHFMFFPVTIILWMIYINNIWSYISMVLTIFIFIYFFKILKSYYK